LTSQVVGAQNLDSRPILTQTLFTGWLFPFKLFSRGDEKGSTFYLLHLLFIVSSSASRYLLEHRAPPFFEIVFRNIWLLSRKNRRMG
jgi:hypothetical protein